MCLQESVNSTNNKSSQPDCDIPEVRIRKEAEIGLLIIQKGMKIQKGVGDWEGHITFLPLPPNYFSTLDSQQLDSA